MAQNAVTRVFILLNLVQFPGERVSYFRPFLLAKTVEIVHEKANVNRKAPLENISSHYLCVPMLYEKICMIYYLELKHY